MRDSPEHFLPLKPRTLEILLALEQNELHGYAILKVLEERGMAVAASLLYRMLRRLMEEELVEYSEERPDPGEDDARRRYYRLTPLGRAVVRAEAARIVGLARSAPIRRLVRGARHA